MSKNSATVAAFGYTQIKDTKKGLLSPTFSIDSNDDGLTWCLHIYEEKLNRNLSYYEAIKEKYEQYKYVGLSLICVSNNSDKPTKVECKFSILNGKGILVQENVKSDILTAKSFSRFSSDSNFDSEFECNSFSFPTFIGKITLLSNLEAVTLNQSISVICEISASSEIENYPNQIETPESVLPHHLELLFENSKYSDVTLSANDGTDFRAHKAILANASQVFEAMFNANMKESFTNRVEITDVSEETLREFLRFIYTGKVLNLQEMAEDLLMAADKYALLTLKVMCETELNRQLSITNALSIFALADMHSLNQLKSYVKNFIHVHLLDVVNTTEWKILNQEHPNLAEEILITP